MDLRSFLSDEGAEDDVEGVDVVGEATGVVLADVDSASSVK